MDYRITGSHENFDVANNIYGLYSMMLTLQTTINWIIMFERGNLDNAAFDNWLRSNCYQELTLEIQNCMLKIIALVHLLRESNLSSERQESEARNNISISISHIKSHLSIASNLLRINRNALSEVAENSSWPDPYWELCSQAKTALNHLERKTNKANLTELKDQMARHWMSPLVP